MSARLSIRLVRLADLPRILEIERACFGKDAYDRKLFAEYTHNCGDLFLVAQEGNTVCGYSITCLCGERLAELVSIAIDPLKRRRGAAALLMDSTLRRLRRRRVMRLRLTVKITNAGARAFYEKYGFRKLRRANRYYEDGSDGLICVKLL